MTSPEDTQSNTSQQNDEFNAMLERMARGVRGIITHHTSYNAQHESEQQRSNNEQLALFIITPPHQE